MPALEVIMILVGVAFILVSFFVEEKLTKKDIDRITSLSEDELRVIVERQLKNAEGEVEDSIADTAADALEAAKRAMERESNEKIMAINEYSDTVIESMNKTHQEIVFLYSMLNDKHVELTNLADQLRELTKQMKNTESEMLNNVAEAAKELENSVQRVPAVSADEMPRTLPEDGEAQEKPAGAEEEKTEFGNHNEQILALYKEGLPEVEIARQLGRGLGEVKLVIGLYRGGANAL